MIKRLLCFIAIGIAVMALYGWDAQLLTAVYWALIAGYWMAQIADEDEG